MWIFFHLNVLNCIDFHIVAPTVDGAKGFLVPCKNFYVKVDRRKNIKSETEIRVWIYCLRLNFLDPGGFRTILFTANQTEYFSVHCKHYCMETDLRQKIKSETKTSIGDRNTNLILLFSVNIFYSVDFHMVLLTVVTLKTFLAYCDHYHMQLGGKERIYAICFSKDSAQFFLSPIDIRLVVLSIDNIRVFLIHCRYYQIVIDAWQKIQSETKNSIEDENTRMNYLSANKILVFHWPLYGSAYSRKKRISCSL